MLLAPQLVGEARARRQRKMDRRERLVEGGSALLFLLAAGAIAAFTSSPREVEPLLMVGLVIGYAAVSRVRFEYSDAYASAEQLVFIPMLVLLPLEYVPLLVCAAGVLSGMPEILAGTWHRQRAIPIVSESWFSVGPVLLLLALAPAPGSTRELGVLRRGLRR